MQLAFYATLVDGAWSCVSLRNAMHYSADQSPLLVVDPASVDDVRPGLASVDAIKHYVVVMAKMPCSS
ncbi:MULTISPECIES: hypothetical protein [unclassified Bradyrhizobium]|uniref:hypothetical protein n=1 Tax=unclassified Bradyrhizobium TaxID=2631580 RepID=UPI00383607E0